MYRFLSYLQVVFILSLPKAWGETATTDTKAADTSYFFKDLGDYLSAPARWDSSDWMTAGLITAGILVISEKYDDNWKREMVVDEQPTYYSEIDKVGEAWGDFRLSGPFMLGVYAYGYWGNDKRYIDASYDMLESVIFAGTTTQILKHTFKRERPNLATDESGWFGGGTSFPSGHTSVAFAVSRSFLNSLDNPSLSTKILFYSLATSTALSRTYGNYHWASDVIAGAVIGIYTADFVSERNKKHRGASYFPFISKDTIGLQIEW